MNPRKTFMAAAAAGVIVATVTAAEDAAAQHDNVKVQRSSPADVGEWKLEKVKGAIKLSLEKGITPLYKNVVIVADDGSEGAASKEVPLVNGEAYIAGIIDIEGDVKCQIILQAIDQDQKVIESEGIEKWYAERSGFSASVGTLNPKAKARLNIKIKGGGKIVIECLNYGSTRKPGQNSH